MYMEPCKTKKRFKIPLSSLSYLIQIKSLSDHVILLRNDNKEISGIQSEEKGMIHMCH